MYVHVGIRCASRYKRVHIISFFYFYLHYHRLIFYGQSFIYAIRQIITTIYIYSLGAL